MSSLAEIKELAEAEAAAKEALKQAIATAAENGIAKTRLARAAGIARTTVDLWISQVNKDKAKD